ncbi:MAG TPA: 2-oxo-4-hydroxy-4-carboxy-5-ureidoimidazoline decarboxylase [Rubrobacteraceae bacterium]|nr:2-oxo-4-hydroxy-4-carboxy-5-ureidoimidazoline decarboxylase [Rubrobacteraceae bacterium]
MPETITIDEVNRLDQDEFVSRFGALYERSPWVAEAAWHESPFADLSGLHEALVRAVHEAPQERQLSLIRAHPDLAGKAAVAGELTAESAGEQASAGLDRLSPGEYEAFTAMNAAYREKYGFPMIVCVREHDKASILKNARVRLGNSYEEEFETALAEIFKIAKLRLRDLVEAEQERG